MVSFLMNVSSMLLTIMGFVSESGLSLSWFNLGISALQALEMILPRTFFLRRILLSPYPCKSFIVQIFLMYPAGQFL